MYNNKSSKKSSQYLNDYTYVYIPDVKGNFKKSRIYIGAYFDFCENKKIIQKYKIIYAVLIFIALTVYTKGLFTISAASVSLFVAIPHITIIFPLILLTTAIIRLFISKSPYDHMTNDGIIVCINRNSSLLLIFALTTLLIDILFIALNWHSLLIPNDFIFTATIIIVGCIGFLMYHFKDTISTYQL